MIYTKSLNYKYETDVFVAGGGGGSFSCVRKRRRQKNIG